MILTVVPPGLLEGLPREDQTAIVEVVGKQVLLVGYEEDGRAELEFTDKHGTIHYIFVNPIFMGCLMSRNSKQLLHITEERPLSAPPPCYNALTPARFR